MTFGFKTVGGRPVDEVTDEELRKIMLRVLSGCMERITEYPREQLLEVFEVMSVSVDFSDTPREK